MKSLLWTIENWMKNHLVSDSSCNIVKSIVLNSFYKEWQIMLGSHLVLVTLHEWVTTII